MAASSHMPVSPNRQLVRLSGVLLNQRVTQVEGAVGSLQNAVSNQFTEQRGHIDHQATEVRLIQENYLSLERRIEEAKQQLEACILAPLAAEAPAAAAGGGEGGQV